MRYLIFILFPFLCLSQQTVEICNDFKTFSYFTSSTEDGIIEWEVNGLYYYGEEIILTWDEAGIYEITAIATSNNCPIDSSIINDGISRTSQWLVNP